MLGINRANRAHNSKSETQYDVTFVEASSLPLTGLLKRYSTGKEGNSEKAKTWEHQFPIDNLNKFIKFNIPNILYSTGLYITANRKDQKRLQENIKNGKMLSSVKKDLETLVDSKLWDGVCTMLDSAGHQIYMNYLHKMNVEPWINVYYKDYVQLETVDLAFSLDIHMDYPLVKHPKEIWELNKLSVEEMYRHDISKIIWVVQFRGALLPLWNKLHRKYKIFDNFNKFAIGGVAKLSKAGIINFPLFFPAACNILKGIKDAGTWNEYYLLHILGVMTSTDFIQFALIAKIARKYHNIPLHVTFDSAKVFRGQAASASLDYIIGDQTVQISFKSKELDNRVKGLRHHDISNGDLLRKLFKTLDETYGYVPCSEEDFYVPNEEGNMVLNKKFWIRIAKLSYIYLNNAIAKVNDVADKLLEYYDAGDRDNFQHLLENHLISYNKGIATKNVLEKAVNVWEGVEMLVNLDQDMSDAINSRIFPSHQIFSYGDQEYLNEDESWDINQEDLHKSIRKI